MGSRDGNARDNAGLWVKLALKYALRIDNRSPKPMRKLKTCLCAVTTLFLEHESQGLLHYELSL